MPYHALNEDDAPICMIPGMAPEYPVYSRLASHLGKLSIVPFIDPLPKESLASYAERMADRFHPNSYIGGVSFGGMLALEISRIVRPKGCIIISSIRNPHQLPPASRICRLIGGRNCSRLLNVAGMMATLVPSSIRTASTMGVTRLAGRSGRWHRWATGAVLDWPGATDLKGVPVVHIHGDSDTTFPVKYVTPDVVIPSGRHSLPISHPDEVAQAINDFIVRLADRPGPTVR